MSDRNMQARDAENDRIKAEAMPLAERLRDLLLSMNDSEKRLAVMDVIKDALCIRCGEFGSTALCYCNYSTMD